MQRGPVQEAAGRAVARDHDSRAAPADSCAEGVSAVRLGASRGSKYFSEFLRVAGT